MRKIFDDRKQQIGRTADFMHKQYLGAQKGRKILGPSNAPECASILKEIKQSTFRESFPSTDWPATPGPMTKTGFLICVVLGTARLADTAPTPRSGSRDHEFGPIPPSSPDTTGATRFALGASPAMVAASQRVNVPPDMSSNEEFSPSTALVSENVLTLASWSSAPERGKRTPGFKPEKEVAYVKNRAPGRRKLANEILLRSGRDPEEEFRVRDTLGNPFGNGLGPIPWKRMKLKDIYVEYGKRKFPALHRAIRPVPNLDRLPDLDEVFDRIFEQTMKVQVGELASVIQNHFDSIGVDTESMPATIFSVERFGAAGYAGLGVKGVYGYIMEVGEDDRSHPYAVSLSDGDLTIEDATGPDWLDSNKAKFFGDDIYFAVSKQPLKFREKIFVKDASRYIASELVDATKEEQKEHAYGKTETEELVDWVRVELGLIGVGLVPWGRFAKPVSNLIKGGSVKGIGTLSEGVSTGSKTISTLSKGATDLKPLVGVSDDVVDALAKTGKTGALMPRAKALAAQSGMSVPKRRFPVYKVTAKSKASRSTQIEVPAGGNTQHLPGKTPIDDLAESTVPKDASGSKSAGWRDHNAKPPRAGQGISEASMQSGLTPDKAGESIRSLPSALETLHSQAQKIEVRKLNRLIRNDEMLESFIKSPTDRCMDALKPVVETLRNAGYETRVRAMYMWSEAGVEVPGNHFLVLAKKDGIEYAVDLTAGQFRQLGMTGPIIAPEELWAKTFQDAAKGKLFKKGTLIKYRDFKASDSAMNAFPSLFPVDPTDPIEGAIILSKPTWYKGPGAKSSY